MKSLFKWALGCFGISIILAVISISLGSWLQYTSYLPLFNALAVGILLLVLASTCISVVGLVRERIRRYRFVILMAVNALFIVWVILD